jgi:hypothetical protein
VRRREASPAHLSSLLAGERVRELVPKMCIVLPMVGKGSGRAAAVDAREPRMFQKFKIPRALLRTLRLPAILRNARARGDERCQAPNRTGNGPTSKKLRRQASPDGEGEERDRQDSRRDTESARTSTFDALVGLDMQQAQDLLG